MANSLEDLFEAARLQMGATKEERLAKARARMAVLNKVLSRQFKSLEVTDELLNKRCTL